MQPGIEDIMEKAEGRAKADDFEKWKRNGMSVEVFRDPAATTKASLVDTASSHGETLIDGQNPFTPIQLSERQMKECNDINSRALSILTHDLRKRREQKASVSNEEKELLTRLAIGSFGTAALHELEDLMGNISLGFGIQAGLLWTVEDQQEFTQCNSEAEQYRLEEHAEISTGEKLVQGDMVVADGDSIGLGADGASSLLELASRGAGNIWDDRSIPYCLSVGLEPRAKIAFKKAVEHITQQVPCLSFYEIPLNKTNPQACTLTPSVLITSNEKGCFSFVGKTTFDEPETRSQQLNLGIGCEMMGMAAHQSLHTLGMVHQTARSDRDTFLEVIEWNVDPNSSYPVNFAANDPTHEGAIFDFYSIMNFPPFAFTVDGSPTMLAKKDVRLSAFLGQRMGMSELDVERLGALYDCAHMVRPQTKNKELVKMLWEGQGYDDGLCRDDKYTGIVRGAKVATCGELADLCFEQAEVAKIRNICPVTCMKCVPGLTELPPATPSGASLAAFGAKGKTDVHWRSRLNAGLTDLGDQKDSQVEPLPMHYVSVDDHSSYGIHRPSVFSESPVDGTVAIGQAPAPVGPPAPLYAAPAGAPPALGAHIPGAPAPSVLESEVISDGLELMLDAQDPENASLDLVKEKVAEEVRDAAVVMTSDPDANGSQNINKFTNFSKFNMSNMSNMSTDARMNVLACIDSPRTGIRFRNGTQTSCDKLAGYCNHRILGPRVTSACKRTCGLCPIELVPNEDMCDDLAATDEPIYELDKKYAECKSLEFFCDDPKIKSKCKKTCNSCPKPISLRWEDVPKKVDDSITTTLYPKVYKNYSKLAMNTGCSRRRAFGYCHTRRRRAFD